MTYSRVNLNFQSGIELNIGRPACDKCFKSKKRCDRNVPCSFCVRKGVECEIKRPILKERKMKDNKQFISQIFNTDLRLEKSTKPDKPMLKENEIKIFANKTELKQTVKKFRNLDNSHFSFEQKNYETPIIYEPEVPTVNFQVPKFNISQTAVGIFSIRGYAAIVNSQDSYAKLYSIKPTHSIYLFSLNTGLLNKNQAVTGQIQLFGRDPLSEHTELLNSAFEMYFTNHNTFFPLFTKMQFKGKKRGFKLKAAIWICGLTYLPRTPETVKIIEYLKVVIETALLPSKLLVNLETVQFMCVLYSGLRGHPLAFKNASFINILTYSTAIGLHQNVDSFSHSDKIERYLAFAIVLALDVSNSTYFLNWESLIDLEPCTLYYNLAPNYKLESGHLEERVKRNALLVIGYYYLVETKLSYQIVQLFDPVGKTLTSLDNQKRLIENQHKLINNTLLELYLKLYELQKLVEENHETVIYIENMHNYLGLVSSSMQSYVAILNGRLNPSLNKHYTPVVINYVRQILRYSENLGEIAPLKFRRRVFSNFSAMMALFQIWTGEESILKLLKGFQVHMRRLLKDPSMQSTLDYCLNIVDSTCQAYGINLDSIQIEY